MRRQGWLRALACALAIAATSQATIQARAEAPAGQTKAFKTTVDYVAHFYPLWFTYYQSSITNKPNRLAGPVRVSPLYQIVVAINVDTYYASAFLDATDGPAMLTIPSTTVSYSILTLDPYGNTYNLLPKQTAGLFALTTADYTGPIPDGATRIDMPYDHMVLIFRADKYTSTNESEQKEARAFRRALLLQPLDKWNGDPTGGKTAILPELIFAAPFKTYADGLIAANPLKFLKQLQKAVLSPNTPAMTPREQKLSDNFNALFGAGGDMSQFALGAQAAHKLILDDYLNHTDKNNWINFTNMGTWKPSQFLDRAAITEFIQYGNNFSTSAYFQTFKDGSGAPLDGANGAVYVLHLTKNQLPDAERFWSFTAYTPESIELIENDLKKYDVASYTPGLTYDQDGGITLYFSQTQPSGVPQANWLPVSSRPFNIMLRVYGPGPNISSGDYVPPPIVKQ
ncbi:MAG TPA: DUF1214 domain-containing protein [Rhizomicrobium sp.]|nr:DUF1214 domain-containing protein [Rhizomicrobium sp.]